MSTVHVVPLDDLIVHAVPGGYDSHGLLGREVLAVDYGQPDPPDAEVTSNHCGDFGIGFIPDRSKAPVPSDVQAQR